VDVVEEQAIVLHVQQRPVTAGSDVVPALGLAAVENLLRPFKILDQAVDVVLVEASTHAPKRNAGHGSRTFADAHCV
jgi:hypothetical protein